MPNGIGVSVTELPNGRWRVRWRETVLEAGVARRVPRERVVATERAGLELQGKILRVLDVGGIWEDEVRVVPVVASFDLAAAAWLRHKRAHGMKPPSIRKYSALLAGWFRAARKILRLADKIAVPVSALTRTLFSEVILCWRADGHSDSTVYSGARVALDAWIWAADDVAEWPGVPRAPRDASAILPLTPLYSAGPAPTLVEVDACIARVSKRAYVACGAAIVMRYTGLRISQVFGLLRSDLDVAARTLTIRTGKTRREAAEHRVVPVTAAFLVDIAPYLGERELVRRRSDVRAIPTKSHHPTIALTAAWKAGTAAGKIRHEVWAPANRRIARPDHAFRAAFQAHLETHGVHDRVIDALVGHAPRTTRSRHYSGVDTLEAAMREAVELIGRIDWTSDAAEERSAAVH